MAANAGQDGIFAIGAAPVAGVRVSNFTRDATPIDITDRDSTPYQELLAGKVSSTSLSFTLDGVEKDRALRNLALGDPANYLIPNVTITLANGDTLAGAFFLGNYTEGDDYKEAVTFSATMTSAGQWTHTPFTPAP